MQRDERKLDGLNEDTLRFWRWQVETGRQLEDTVASPTTVRRDVPPAYTGKQ